MTLPVRSRRVRPGAGTPTPPSVRPSRGDPAIGRIAERTPARPMKPTCTAQLLGVPAVVGVEEGDEPPAPRADAVVARCRRTAVVRPQRWSRMRGSSAASRAAITRQPSLEPSSTSSNSQAPRVCAWTEATVSASVAAAFQTGVTTVTAGTSIGARRSLLDQEARVPADQPAADQEQRAGDAEHVGHRDVVAS